MSDLKQAQIFTPPHITNQMLDLLGEGNLSDHNTFFFEPTCGNGEMLIVIIERIFNSLLIKYDGDKAKALCETMFKFYATELDESLVPVARMRVFNFFSEKYNGLDASTVCSYLLAHQIQQSIEHRDALKESIPCMDTTAGARAIKRIFKRGL